MDNRRAILVIDDERSVFESLRWIFASHYRVIWARSLTEAGIALDSDLGVAIVDLHLNGDSEESGADVVAHLRFFHPHLPVIVLSGFLELGVVTELARLGVRVFISKPFEFKEMIEAVEDEVSEASKLAVYREWARPARWPQLRSLGRRISNNAVRYYKPVGFVLGLLGSGLMWIWFETGLSQWFTWWQRR